VASEKRLRQKRINVNLDSAVHDRFKAAVSADGKKMTGVLVDFIERYIRKAERGGAKRGKGQ
jgi:ParG